MRLSFRRVVLLRRELVDDFFLFGCFALLLCVLTVFCRLEGFFCFLELFRFRPNPTWATFSLALSRALIPLSRTLSIVLSPVSRTASLSLETVASLKFF